MRDERCNRCGGALRRGVGVVPLLTCESCGREIPAAALAHVVERRSTVDSTRFFHQEQGRTTVLVVQHEGVQLHTRLGEVRMSWETLEWLLIAGGPAAIDARRHDRLPAPATVAAKAAA